MINDKDENSNSALHGAATLGHVSVVKVIDDVSVAEVEFNVTERLNFVLERVENIVGNKKQRK